jgi:hypothetical protein
MHGHRCPSCGSSDVTGRKSGGMPDGGHLREFGCFDCGLIESRRSDAPDYGTLVDRWDEPRPQQGTES